MAEQRVKGVLHGRERTIKVKADDEFEAINKVKAKYPDFEVARQQPEPAQRPIKIDPELDVDLSKRTKSFVGLCDSLIRAIRLLSWSLIGILGLGTVLSLMTSARNGGVGSYVLLMILTAVLSGLVIYVTAEISLLGVRFMREALAQLNEIRRR